MAKTNKQYRRRNVLIANIRHATLTGSFKTKKNNVAAAKRFAGTLYELGYKVKKWRNIRNNHVAAVVKEWKKQGLTTATIKSYLSGVKAVATGSSNDRIHTDNSQFGLGRRNYVATHSRAVPENVFQRVMKELQQSKNERFKRIAAQMLVMRLLGLRHEEARKINPRVSLRKDGSIYISAGTKGGRDRILLEPTEEQINAVKALTPFIGQYGNSWPDNIKERTWEKYTYKVTKALGLSIQACGASLHGLRHAFAHSRYTELTNLQPPCLYSNPSEFRQAAYAEHGEDWRTIHDQAVNLLAHELGHNRSDVAVNYLGTIHG